MQSAFLLFIMQHGVVLATERRQRLKTSPQGGSIVLVDARPEVEHAGEEHVFKGEVVAALAETAEALTETAGDCWNWRLQRRHQFSR
mmetsp:Transcript_22736/g.53539  ORF Transcript_22736/g.53539 Transcript_22736/m.53539 type:complete len:87 (+) Transcript_22736:47-307(+)